MRLCFYRYLSNIPRAAFSQSCLRWSSYRKLGIRFSVSQSIPAKSPGWALDYEINSQLQAYKVCKAQGGYGFSTRWQDIYLIACLWGEKTNREGLLFFSLLLTFKGQASTLIKCKSGFTSTQGVQMLRLHELMIIAGGAVASSHQQEARKLSFSILSGVWKCHEPKTWE